MNPSVTRVRSSAKINLSLDILGRRSDGYHELSSVVHTVGWWDEIEIEWRNGNQIEFDCSRADLNGSNNLCVRAIEAWRAVTSIEVGAKIRLQKHIPTGAGLGGGSGNAAAILLALQDHFNAPLSDAVLNNVAARLGADVPLFVRGGALLMEGIGEKITPLAPLNGWVSILKPSLALDTGAVYRAWKENGFASVRATPNLLEVWQKGDVHQIVRHCGNDLERAAQVLSPLPSLCLEALRFAGAQNPRMSGSGSACFALWDNETAAHEALQKAAMKAKEMHLPIESLCVAPLCSQGVQKA